MLFGHHWPPVAIGILAIILVWRQRAVPGLLAALVCSTIVYRSPYVYVLLCVALFGLLLWSRQASLARPPFNLGVMGGLFGVAALSSILTRGQGPTFMPLATWALAGLYYWTLSAGLRVVPGPTMVWTGIMGTGLICIGTCIPQFVAGDYRVAGPTAHPNNLALFLNIYFPVLLMWGCDQTELTPWRRILSIVMAATMAILVLPTLSRTGLLIECLSVVLMTTVTLARPANPQQRVGVLAVVVAVAVALSLGGAAHAFWQRNETAPESNITSRFVYIRVAQAMVRDHPLGVGLEKFTVFAAEKGYQGILGHYPVNECHNVFWQVTAETGWAGLVLFVVVVGRFWIVAWRRAAAASFRPTLPLGILVGYVAAALTGLAEPTLIRAPFLQVLLTLAALSLPPLPYSSRRVEKMCSQP